MLYIIHKIYQKPCNFLFVLMALVAISSSNTMGQEHVIQAGRFFLLKDYDNAIKEYRLAIKQNPDDPLLQYNIAICYEKTGDVKSAINSYQRALKLRPDFTQAQRSLDKLLSGSQGRAFQDVQAAMLKANNAFFIKDYDEAIRQYTRVIQIDSENFTAHFNLAFCYEQKENYAQALRSYERALALNAKSEEAQTAVQRTENLLKIQKIAKLKDQIETELGRVNFKEALDKVNELLAIDAGNKWALNRREVIKRRLEQQIKAASEVEADTSEKLETVIQTAPESDSLTNFQNEDSLRVAAQQDETLDLPYLFLILGGVIVFGILITLLIIKSRNKTPTTDELIQKGVYGTLQEYFNTRKTGILSIVGTTQAGETIQGEVRVLKGNIVDAHTNEMAGADALHQLFELEQPNHMNFQEVQVSSAGNIRQATLPLLMQWTLGMNKKE